MPFPLIFRILTLYGPLVLSRIFPFTTRKYVACSIAGGLLWELWTFLNKAPADTISEIVWEFTDQTRYGRFPAFVAAFLFAHWFLQRKPESLKKDPLFNFLDNHPETVIYLGLVCGYLVWQRAPQPRTQGT